MAFLIPEQVRTVNAIDFTNSYMPIGAPLAADALLLRIFNSTDQPILISFDGVTDADYIEAGQVFEIDCLSGPNSIEAGTQFYINGFAGPYNWGTVYLSAWHG